MPLPPAVIPVNTIGRLSLYRRILQEQLALGSRQIYSHELARLAVSTAAQVRRDLMTIGFSGSPRKGYAIPELAAAVEVVLARSVETAVALVGVGNLGRAILAYYANRQPVRFAAAFDRAPEKTGRILHGCRCYPLADLAAVVSRERIHVGVIAVPSSEAQGVADQLVLAGVRGILNFAPVRLHVPPGMYVEHVDLMMALDKVAYYAHQQVEQQDASR
ncbi:MAG TPA: redox-sensing transcriptional repressor Rex [Vicinamibacterales bacterium]|nr:redox-sensing transcriptional repressor Rex [Vicinamibacterales bacterium]